MSADRPANDLQSSTSRPCDGISINPYGSESSFGSSGGFNDLRRQRMSGVASSVTVGHDGGCAEHDEFGADFQEESEKTIEDYRTDQDQSQSDSFNSFLNKRVSTFTKNMTTLSRMASDLVDPGNSQSEEFTTDNKQGRFSFSGKKSNKLSALAKPSMKRGQTYG